MTEDNKEISTAIVPSRSGGKPMLMRWRFFCLLYTVTALVAPLGWLIFTRFGAGVRWDWTDPKVPTASEVLYWMHWIAAVGASMGALHSLASLSVRAGRETLYDSWVVFYFARPLTGAGVAIVTYLVLVSGIGGFNVLNPVALLAWAALAGLYSEQALAKLRDVFKTLLKPDKDPTNDGSATPPTELGKEPRRDGQTTPLPGSHATLPPLKPLKDPLKSDLTTPLPGSFTAPPPLKPLKDPLKSDQTATPPGSSATPPPLPLKNG